MKPITRVIAISIIVACYGCDSGTTTRTSDSADTPSITPTDLLGHWELQTVGSEAPSKINIKSHVLKINADGTWTGKTLMDGKWAGMEMASSGEWSLSKDTVTFTAGDNNGQSQVTIESGNVHFMPDFIIAVDGETPSSTTYTRLPNKTLEFNEK